MAKNFKAVGFQPKAPIAPTGFVWSWRLKECFALAFDREGPLNILSNTALTAQGSDSYAMLVSSTKSGGTAHGCPHSRVGVSVLVCMSLTLGSASYLTKAIYVTVKYFFHR